MRWYIIRVLLIKEALRHLANRGGLALLAFLIVLMVLLSLFKSGTGAAGGLIGGVQLCYVDYWEYDPWVQHLEQHVPPELSRQIRFRSMRGYQGGIQYPGNTGAIQIRPQDGAYLVWFWHPGQDSLPLAPYEDWFWKETRRFYQAQAVAELKRLGVETADRLPPPDLDKRRWAEKEALQRVRDQVAAVPDAGKLPELASKYSQLTGAPDMQTTLAAGLVLGPLFILSVFLLPSLTCEERERGVLLAQVLSPASPDEILAAKFIFYQVLSMAAAALMAGIFDPKVLARGFFWLALAVAAFGSQAIGLTIASIARTQRAASTGAMCYMMAVLSLLVVCQVNRIPFLSYLAIEYYVPRMLQAAMSKRVLIYHWGNLMGAAALAAMWGLLAIRFFRRQGWQ